MSRNGMSRRDVFKLLGALGVAAPACASAQGAATTNPKAPPLKKGDKTPAGGTVVFNDNGVLVSEHVARSRLGVCGTGWHTHPPHLSVCLTEVKAKVSLPGKEPFVAENKAGDVFWDPGGSHAVENLGGRDTKVYLVELWS
jgi:hypothetical protein